MLRKTNVSNNSTIWDEIEASKRKKKKEKHEWTEEELKEHKNLRNIYSERYKSLELNDMVKEMSDISRQHESINLNAVLDFVNIIFNPRLSIKKLINLSKNGTLIINGCLPLPNVIKILDTHGKEHLWFYDEFRNKTFLFIGRTEVSRTKFEQILRAYNRKKARQKRYFKKQIDGVDKMERTINNIVKLIKEQNVDEYNFKIAEIKTKTTFRYILLLDVKKSKIKVYETSKYGVQQYAKNEINSIVTKLTKILNEN